MVRKDSLHGEQSLCEYVPSGTLAFGGVGKRMMSEHVLSNKLTPSGACRIHSLHIPVIRVQRRVQGWQFPLSHQSGVPSAGGAAHGIWR